MLKCSNAQMLKCSNAQSQNAQMQMLRCKCSNAQMLKHSNAQTLKCSNAQTLKCSNAQTQNAQMQMLKRIGWRGVCVTLVSGRKGGYHVRCNAVKLQFSLHLLALLFLLLLSTRSNIGIGIGIGIGCAFLHNLLAGCVLDCKLRIHHLLLRGLENTYRVRSLAWFAAVREQITTECSWVTQDHLPQPNPTQDNPNCSSKYGIHRHFHKRATSK